MAMANNINIAIVRRRKLGAYIYILHCSWYTYVGASWNKHIHISSPLLLSRAAGRLRRAVAL